MKLIITILIFSIIAIGIWGAYLRFAPFKCPEYVNLMPIVSFKQSILHKLCPNSLVVQ